MRTGGEGTGLEWGSLREDIANHKYIMRLVTLLTIRTLYDWYIANHTYIIRLVTLLTIRTLYDW